MLPDQAYEALIDAVGQENVSREPVVLDGYAWQPTFNYNPELWMERPSAVVLPGSTEEVRQTILVCNEYGLKFKALSTGWCVTAAPWCEGVVILDLRRMNRILEIDEKNMYVVVEPCAIGAQIQAEVMRYGLNIHMIGAGCISSPLASATSFMGHGWDGIYMSYSPRNVLGVEWVLPSGKVLKLGTPGSGLGWFSGDGPGPSLRGIMRGAIGACGGVGVFTKCALKLFNWPGPPVVEAEGLGLDTKTELPQHFKVYLCFLPDWDSFADSMYEIGEAEIGYIINKNALGLLLSVIFPRLTRKIAKRKAIKETVDVLKNEFEIILAGNSEREISYQVEVLEDIISRNGGFLFDLGDNPLVGIFWWGLVRNYAPPILFRPGGQFMTLFGSDDSFDSQVTAARLGERIKKEWLEKDLIYDDLGDTSWMHIFENGMWGHCEVPFIFDPRNRRQVEAVMPEAIESVMASLEKNLGVGMLAMEPLIRKIASPMQGNYNKWQKEFQRIIDPRGAADSALYTGEAEIDLSTIDPNKLQKMTEIIMKNLWTESGPPR